MKVHQIITGIILTLLFGMGQVSARTADNSTIYDKIENAILDADFTRMDELVRYLDRLIADTPESDYTEAISLNEASGLLYHHLGYQKKGHEAFMQCWNLAERYAPDDTGLRQRILFGILITSSDIIKDIARNIDYLKDSGNSYYNRFNMGFNYGFYQVYDGAIEKFLEAADLCSAEINNRWARLVYTLTAEKLCEVYTKSGEYDIALANSEDFQKIADQKIGENSYFHITSEIDRSRIYLLLGNLPKAQESLKKASSILLEKTSSATGLNAEIFELQGDIAYELKDYQSAYDSFEKARASLVTLEQETVPVMTKEMTTLYKMGRIEECDAICDEIDVLIDKYKNPVHHAEQVHQFSMRLIDEKFNALAIDLLKTALEELEDTFGDYDSVLKVKNALGGAHITVGDYNSAIELYKEVIRQEKKRAHDIFAFLPERQRELYWKKKEPLMENIFRLNQEGTVTAGYGSVFENRKDNKSLSSPVLYDASLLNKGLLLETFLNMQRTILSSGDQELIDAFNELRKLMGSDPARADMLEQTIISRLGSYGDYMDFTHISWKDIHDSLREGEAAIEFVVSKSNRMSYYSAEVLRKEYDSPKHVFLFAQKEEDTSMNRMDIYEKNTLYKKIWGKLEDHLKGCRDIYFAPVGEFYRIGIEYLPVNDSVRINDRFNIYRLSSTKSLVRRNDTQSVDLSSATLYGGLDYNLDGESMEYYAYTVHESVKRGPAVDLYNSMSLKDINWGYLRGTAEEVTNISGILGGMDCTTTVYMGGEGVEESFKILNDNSPEVIHIATHGFILEPSNDISISTGLVFAGANNYGKSGRPAVEGIDDGLLTSREIAEMNLTGAELVVLSACQTGAGQISGEGVFGLQRGFKKASAKTLLMSLWEVDDRATNELMTKFYSCLASGMDKHTALHHAQDHVKATCGPDPKLWAGFILLD